MSMCNEEITLRLQIALNKKMLDTGRIPYDLYSKANGTLIYKLTDFDKDGIINQQ